MSSRLELKGMDEFRRALRELPEDLAQEASAIVLAQGEEAQRQIRTAYPQGPTGNLKRGVTVEHNTSKFTTRAIVRSRAKHSSLFERGTKPRRTSKGWNRGTMPEAPESQRMIPIVIRRRRAMVAALIELVRRAGFQVTTT